MTIERVIKQNIFLFHTFKNNKEEMEERGVCEECIIKKSFDEAEQFHD